MNLQRWLLMMPLALGLLSAPARAESWSTNFVCFRGGSYDGWDESAITNSVSLGGGSVTLSSGSDQNLSWTDSEAGLQAMTLTVLDEGTPLVITAGGTIRIGVPSAWGCRFDASVTSPSFGGSAAGKVNSAATYSGDGRTLIIHVTASFRNGDVLTVGGIKLADLHMCPEGPEKLELDFTGDGSRDGYDEYSLAMSVLWPGGFYDGWDDFVTADPLSVGASRRILMIMR